MESTSTVDLAFARSRFHAVLVDNGGLRAQRETDGSSWHNLHVTDATERFLSVLAGASEPEKKRKIIGGLYLEIFEETAVSIAEAAKDCPAAGTIEWLL